MNITDLNDADLQALDELNRHCFQAMDPLLRNGAQADEAGPKSNLRANPPDDGALDNVAATLLAPPGGPLPPGGGNPHGMLWKNLVEALKLEPGPMS
jgi:hypothetical protein